MAVNGYMTAEEVAEELSIKTTGVYSAVHRGHFRPVRMARRNLFPVDQVEAYKRYLANRWAVKDEAKALWDLVGGEKPEGVDPRKWAVFSDYATIRESSVNTLALEYHMSRQNIHWMIRSVVDTLLELAKQRQEM